MKKNTHLAISIWISATLSFLTSAYASPNSLDFQAKISLSGERLHLTITPDSTAEGCSYRVFGWTSADGSNAITVATLPASESILALRAASLNSIDPIYVGNRTSQSLQMAVEATCPDGNVGSNPVRIRLTTRSGGRLGSVEQWLQQLRTRFTIYRLKLAEAFPNLPAFQLPLSLQNAGDGSNRLFVVERSGKIKVFNNSANASSSSIFLDITAKVKSDAGELGLLGLAFHPNYKTNGFFYIYYTRIGSTTSIIARYTVSATNPNAANPASETILLSVPQPFDNHKGGQLAFDQAGLLYISLGDGGSGGDPMGNGQNRGVLLGKILRIDVNRTQPGLNYAIPANNPFTGNLSGWREEIFAYGLRNPWRFSFDYDTGRLWAGDVEQDMREEIDIIQSGRNYGWNKAEGSICYPANASCNPASYTLPVLDYGRDLGSSVIGGYVWRAAGLLELNALYIFGDFVSGRIFGLAYDRGQRSASVLFKTNHLISAFGVDESRVVYVVSYSAGRLLKFAETIGQ